MKKTNRSAQRKRPHILPPLKFLTSNLNPMEPLKPPSALMTMEGRLGSPVPRWQRPHDEDMEPNQENPGEIKPGIRITLCMDQEYKSKPNHKSYWTSDLRNDPLYKEDTDLGYSVQRRNSIKNLGLEQRSNGLGHETSPRLATPVVKPISVEKGRPKTIYSDKGLMPKKYGPLKPIQRNLSNDMN